MFNVAISAASVMATIPSTQDCRAEFRAPLCPQFEFYLFEMLTVCPTPG